MKNKLLSVILILCSYAAYSQVGIGTPMPNASGAFAHKWSQIERAVLTKDFFFLYVKDDDHHIISISNKFNNGRNINELIAFVERNVIEITKM